MNSDKSFHNSTCADQIRLAERELASFIGAVEELFGPEQALRSADDWLDEFELMNRLPRSTSRDWRAVTVAASARLAHRVTVAREHRTPAASTDAKAPPIPSPICSYPLFFLARSAQLMQSEMCSEKSRSRLSANRTRAASMSDKQTASFAKAVIEIDGY